MPGGREGANGRDVGSEVGNVSEQRRGRVAMVGMWKSEIWEMAIAGVWGRDGG